MGVDYDSNRLKLAKAQNGFLHHKFGDLNRSNFVMMDYRGAEEMDFAPKPPFYIHLSITGKCYARCRGCINSAITLPFHSNQDHAVPIEDSKPERDAKCIIDLIQLQGEGEVVICFYGGEPLLAVDKINHVFQILNESNLVSKYTI